MYNCQSRDRRRLTRAHLTELVLFGVAETLVLKRRPSFYLWNIVKICINTLSAGKRRYKAPPSVWTLYLTKAEKKPIDILYGTKEAVEQNCAFSIKRINLYCFLCSYYISPIGICKALYPKKNILFIDSGYFAQNSHKIRMYHIYCCVGMFINKFYIKFIDF